MVFACFFLFVFLSFFFSFCLFWFCLPSQAQDDRVLMRHCTLCIGILRQAQDDMLLGRHCTFRIGILRQAQDDRVFTRTHCSRSTVHSTSGSFGKLRMTGCSRGHTAHEALYIPIGILRQTQDDMLLTIRDSGIGNRDSLMVFSCFCLFVFSSFCFCLPSTSSG